jgi:hypothetical protein
MGIRRSRKNRKHVLPYPRRAEVIRLLTCGLARMAGGELPPEESAESCQKALGSSAQLRLSVPAG